MYLSQRNQIIISINNFNFSWRTDDTQCTSTQTWYSHKAFENNDNAVTSSTTTTVLFMGPEVGCNHQESTENVAEKFVSQWRPGMRAEFGAVACVRLLSMGLQSLNGARTQVRHRENQGGQLFL